MPWYSPSGRRIAIAVILTILGLPFLLILAIWMAFSPDPQLMSGLVTIAVALAPLNLLLIALVAGGAWLILRLFRLEVSDGGISYVSPWYRVAAGWDDVDRIGPVPLSFGSRSGLILKRSSVTGNGLAVPLVEGAGLSKSIVLKFHLGPFTQNMWGDGLEELLKQHAPGLFETPDRVP